MKINLYRFGKNENELKIPSGAGTEVDCYLKESTSVLKPVLILDFNPAIYNYLYIPDFKRYYFITDVRFIGNETFEMQASCDVMGSWRESILNSTQYITRSASGWNKDILDNMFPATAGMKKNVLWSQQLTAISDFKTGIFVLGVLGNKSGIDSLPVSYYALSYEQFKSLNAFLYNKESYGTMISDDIVKAFFNPLDYIVSCVFIPIKIDTEEWLSTNIEFGWFSTSIQCKLINYYSKEIANYDFQINAHYNDFRQCSPWSSFRLWLVNEYFTIPPEKIYNAKKASLSMSLDLISGLAMFTFKVDGKELFNTVQQFGCPIAIAQTRQDWTGTLSSVFSTASSVLSGNITSIFDNVVDAVDSLVPDPSVRGANGTLGTAYWKKGAVLEEYYFDTVELNPLRVGRAVEKTDVIKNYSGFTKVRNAEVELQGAYESEFKSIASIMEGGFYVN